MIQQNSQVLGYIPSLLQSKCPRCRTGDLFIYKSAYHQKFLQMHEQCLVCGQPTEIEPHFYYGTGYVSYALAVAVSVASFVAWWVIIGFSLQDQRFFWWMGFNAVLLLALQPPLMRLSRTIWLSFFVKYKKRSSRMLKRKRILGNWCGRTMDKRPWNFFAAHCV